MPPLRGNVRRRGNKMLLTLIWAVAVAAIDITLCANFNTASTDSTLNIYQTNGLCHDTCVKKKQAYAITQGNACWCSDYTPSKAAQVDKDKCDRPCPAWPSEFCGGDNVFSYVLLNVASPAGTKGPDSDDSSKTSSKESTPEPSSTSRSTSEFSSPTESPTPATSVRTVTAGGTVQTVTIVPLQTHSAEATELNAPTDLRADKNGLSTGGIVGIVFGVVLGVLGLAAMALFVFFQRKKRRDGDYQEDPSVRGSSSGMLGGRSDMSGIPGSPGSTGNRSSMLQVDPRMNPFQQGMYARNGSRESINTLRDDHDYSRRIQQPKVLRAVNPDPDDGN